MKLSRLLSLCLLLLSAPWPAAAELVPRQWTVDGAARAALIFVPAGAKAQATPVVFAFHGHGGNMNQAARSFGFEKLWPEALVVYPQGLKTPGKLTDPEGKRPGWQHDPGEQADRDLKFFDAMLAGLREEFRVDEKRIYATGHSNGGAFTYLLWAARGDCFAAMAPSAAVAAKCLPLLKPKPVLHLAGEADELVKYSWQRQMMTALRKLNGCEEGQPAGEWMMRYPSKSGTPVKTFIHPGGHRFPPEAPAEIVKFFQEHKMP